MCSNVSVLYQLFWFICYLLLIGQADGIVISQWSLHTIKTIASPQPATSNHKHQENKKIYLKFNEIFLSFSHWRLYILKIFVLIYHTGIG